MRGSGLQQLIIVEMKYKSGKSEHKMKKYFTLFSKGGIIDISY